ncbi:pentraxin fusion protein-like [Triplophysa rosa]|uniref:pentraxin fusion protein-like n=1 Tax=Triplophysa rosa TaxID=992332 RepID=UPI002546165A|nr:pentraxin fusion protein-like [Triplophysa rosa]
MDKLIHLILLSGLVSIADSLEDNLALNGTTTQSSTYSTWAAPHAIDGVRYGPHASTYCSSTSYDSDPWWRLDLLDVYNISTVIISARSFGYFAETSGAEIRIGNSLDNNGNNNPICAVTSVLQFGQTISYSCGVMEGRYVNVVMSGRTTHLSVCEVEVYETENLASKGTVARSSTYSTWAAPHAIDGVRYGTDNGAFCSATTSESDPWWRLDLLDIYKISTVIITAKSDGSPDFTSGAWIRIGNSLENNGNNNPICAVTPDPLPGHTVSYSCHGMEGRYVNVVMTGRTSTLTLCEVEVYGTENLAVKGTVTQSSIRSSWFSQHAIDGVRHGPDPDTVTY